jgi:hypothetical protein
MSIRIKIAFEIPYRIERLLFWPLELFHSIRLGQPVRIIPLTRGKYTIVDPDDYDWLNQFKWCASKFENTYYAIRTFRIGRGRTSSLFMHRAIMNPPARLLVDHHNLDGLDNRKSNLRIATHSENMFNRRKTSAKTHSRYIGVSYIKNTRKWRASICTHGKTINLGRFNDELSAARAYDAAAIKYHKEFARLNFK